MSGWGVTGAEGKNFKLHQKKNWGFEQKKLKYKFRTTANKKLEKKSGIKSCLNSTKINKAKRIFANLEKWRLSKPAKNNLKLKIKKSGFPRRIERKK